MVVRKKEYFLCFLNNIQFTQVCIKIKLKLYFLAVHRNSLNSYCSLDSMNMLLSLHFIMVKLWLFLFNHIALFSITLLNTFACVRTHAHTHYD